MRADVLNADCREVVFPQGLMVSDPPYNIGYHYNSHKDNHSLQEYKDLLRVIKKPCVVIHYPEFAMNHFKDVFGDVDEVVFWVYNSNTAKQSRVVCWYGCKPDFKKVGQAYKNPNDKRIAKRIAEGKTARAYDWWNINQVKNVSKKNTSHTCPIPQELAEKIIRATATPGQIIIDPFSGSGTVLRAAKACGHGYFGVEKDELYYSESKASLQAQVKP